uniref:Uncharacterized protein n=1 Tax=Oryza nivara TaxID=4536 RepID=A0A0E0HKK5_ORYNI
MLCQQAVPIHRGRRSARRRWPLAVRRPPSPAARLLPESSSTTAGALDLLRYGRNFRRASPPPRPPLVNSAEPSSAQVLREPDVKDEEDMLRRMYKGLDQPRLRFRFFLVETPVRFGPNNYACTLVSKSNFKLFTS